MVIEKTPSRAGGHYAFFRFVEKGDNLLACDGRFHFHRVFKEIFGVTPKAYAEARRRVRVQGELREASSVTAAIYAAGYNASSRFYQDVDARIGMSPSAYRNGGQDRGSLLRQ